MTQAQPLPHHPHLSIGECGGGVVWVKGKKVLSRIRPLLKNKAALLEHPNTRRVFQDWSKTITASNNSAIALVTALQIIGSLTRGMTVCAPRVIPLLIQLKKLLASVPRIRTSYHYDAIASFKWTNIANAKYFPTLITSHLAN